MIAPASIATRTFDPRPAVAGLMMAWAGASAEAADPFDSMPGDAEDPRTAKRSAMHRFRPPAPLARAPAQAATTVSVTNCNNTGAGSLRAAVATHASVIDMTALACSTISLSTGAIIIDHAVPDVALYGPTDHPLTIDGNHLGRVLVHNGEGTLTLDHLTLTNGSYLSGYYGGGCIYAFGSAVLQNSTVSNCTVSLENYVANGGGLLVKHDLTLNASVLSGNQALGNDKKTHGGGAFVAGNLVVNGSSVLGNSTFTVNNSASGGGLYVQGSAQVYASTISGNMARFSGGIDVLANATFSNSTISGNSATQSQGGINVLGSLVLDNSTVAFNTHASIEFGAGVRALGVLAHSSIVANNTSTGNGHNVDLLCSSCFPSGSNNLITGSNSDLPLDTIVADPLLGPLADNGGPTHTHALLPGSPAIEAGSNIHGFPFDQRGHVRIFGPAPDIGAFESGIDPIFADGFESHP